MSRRPEAVSTRVRRAVSLPFSGRLVPARFRRRPNRFVVEAALDRGRVVAAHLADPGRLTDLLTPGNCLWLRPAEGVERTRRKTSWSVVLARSPSGDLVSVDTGLPNRLVNQALEHRALDELAGWRLERREVPVGRHRFDFLLRSEGGEPLYLEVKSVTLVEKGVGLFPDAVAERGRRHLRALAGMARAGDARATVLFLAQRCDLSAVTAAEAVDPRFARAFREAQASGVRMLARRCRVTTERITLAERIEVLSDLSGTRRDLL